jgi:hypothetical protein
MTKQGTKLGKQLPVYMIVGFIIGISGTLVNWRDVVIQWHWLAIGFGSLAAIALVIHLYFYGQLKRSMTQSNLDEDALDRYQYRTFADARLAGVVALVMGLLALGITLPHHVGWGMLFFVIVVLAIISETLLSQLVTALYPERHLPNVGDENYQEKLLAASDEGERHVMLTGMYKTYQTTSIALTLGMTFLMIYALLTDQPQTIGLIVLAIVMLVMHGQYIWIIRQKD